MFVRKKKFDRKKGITYKYYLEKAVKEKGKFKMITVKYLGDAEKILKVYGQAEFCQKNHKQ